MALVAAMAIVAGFAPAGYSSAASATHPAPGISAKMRAALLEAATVIATENGDSHPRDVEAVRTTHRRAEHLLCGDCELKVVPPGATVYVVAMRGHFRCNSCSHPRSATIGPANVIALQFMDPHDLRNVQFNYGGPYPKLRSVGPPVRL
jgi:hypothetical protein